MQDMDCRVHRSKAELDSTGYVEIGPGRYSGKHWQDGFVFVEEKAFVLAAGIVSKHFPDYDHFAMNSIPGEVAQQVVADWRDVSNRLEQMSPDETCTILNLPPSVCAHFQNSIMAQSSEIASLFRQLADECEQFLKQHEWVSILGV